MDQEGYFNIKCNIFMQFLFMPFIIITQILPIMNPQNNYDYIFKYIAVGDTNVGKSCLIQKYIEGNFKSEHQPTLGVQFASKNIELEGLTLKIQIWDTAGQQSFKAITRSYYKGSIAAFLVFDITCKSSFESLHKWLYEVKNYSHENVQIALIGNKLDLKSKREVSFEEAQTFARNNGFSYIEVSAFSGMRVEECFNRMGERVLKKIKEKEINPDGDSSMGIKRGKKHKKEIISQSNVKLTNGSTGQNKSQCCK